ncbi:MAG: InlB B-repeat-containing protein [Bacillota bacterium]
MWPADPTRTNYTFGGWFTGENGADTQFASAIPVNATTTVYAKWMYRGGGGGGSSSGIGSAAPATPTYNADVKAGNGSHSILPVIVDKNSGSRAWMSAQLTALCLTGKPLLLQYRLSPMSIPIRWACLFKVYPRRISRAC